MCVPSFRSLDPTIWQAINHMVEIHTQCEFYFLSAAHCSFTCTNESTGCTTNRTIAGMLAISISYRTNQATGCPIKELFVAVLVIFIV